MLQVEERPDSFPGVARVHQHRPAPEEIPIAFHDEIDRRVEQGVTGADEGGEGLTRHGNEALLERDALVAG